MADLLKVAHVVLSLDIGGLEHVVLDLVREGQKSGQEVAVLCLERPGTLAQRVEALGAAVRCVYKRPGLKLGIARRIKAVLEDLRPDVVHTHQIGALFYAGPAARRAGVPVVVHTEHGRHFANRRTRWLGWLAARSAAKFFCVSRDIATEVLGYRIAPPRKVTVVPNGIDLNRFRAGEKVLPVRETLGIPAGAPVIGTVGRLNEIKRHDLLIRAFARVRRDFPQAHLLLVGDGPLADELRRLAAALGVSEDVHFAGYQPRPEHYLRAMDVFALTSRSEGMPLAVLEAWAAGLPVIATRVGGLPEMTGDGTAALLVPGGDEDALTRGLHDLLERPSFARQLAEVGRGRVETIYGLQQMALTYQDHYWDVLSQNVMPV
jgi:glycosyltransferase involved in cell wall biosynthesis